LPSAFVVTFALKISSITCSGIPPALSVISNLYSLSFIESPSASLILDKDGTILQANNSFSHLMGYTINELIGD